MLLHLKYFLMTHTYISPNICYIIGSLRKYNFVAISLCQETVFKIDPLECCQFCIKCLDQHPPPELPSLKIQLRESYLLSDVSHTQCTAAGFLNLRSKVRWPGPAQLILMIGLRFPPQTCGKIKVGVASCKLEYFPSSSNRFRSDDFAERPFLHGFSARVRKDHSWVLLKILLI